MTATITDIGAAKRKRFFDAATSGLEDYVSKLEATGVRATDAIIVLRTFTMPGGHNVSFVRMQHLADAFGPGMPDFIEDNRTLINDGMFIVGVVDEQDKWSWFSFGLAPEPTLEQKTAWHFRRTKQANECWFQVLGIVGIMDRNRIPRDSYVVMFEVSATEAKISAIVRSRFDDAFDEWSRPLAHSLVGSLNSPDDFALMLRDNDGVSGAIRNTKEVVS